MAMISLTKGLSAQVDIEDYVWLVCQKWMAQDAGKRQYACRSTWDGKKKGSEMMHRAILVNHGYDVSGMDVDHKDGNGLNNCKSNLRLCTRSENMRNMRREKSGRSRYKGVSWDSQQGKWTVRIKLPDKYLFGGYFVDEMAAANKYDELADRHFGEFARKNCG